MNELKIILSIARKCQLGFVVVMALLMVSQPAWSTQDHQISMEIQDDASQENEVFVVETPTMVTPLAHTHIDHVFYEIMVIEYDSDSEEKEFLEIHDDESFKRILFRRVISPNAP